MSPRKFSMTAILDFNTESLEAFIQLLETVIDSITRNKNSRFTLKVAVNELVVNAVEHGYNKLSGPVSVRLVREADSILLEVSDNGKGVRLEALNLDRVINSVDDLTVRGWGLPIINKVSSHFIVKPNQPTGTTISLIMPL